MLVREFLEKAHNEPLASNAAPSYYLALFLAVLDYFAEERCSVLSGKIRAQLSPEELKWIAEEEL